MLVEIEETDVAGSKHDIKNSSQTEMMLKV